MLFILHSLFLSSTVVEALISVSDVRDQQVVGLRGKVSLKLKTRERLQRIIVTVNVGLRWIVFWFKDKRRLVLMRTVPEPHYVYAR